MKKVVVRLLIVGIVSIGGCAGSDHTVSSEKTFVPDPAKAVVVYSSSILGRCGGIPAVTLHGKGGAGAGARNEQLVLGSPVVQPDFSDPPGFFIVREVEPGEYWFDELELSGTSGARKQRVYVHFAVEAGKVYYLGEFYLTTRDCSHYRMLTDRFLERDRTLLKERFASLRTAEVVNLRLSPSRTDEEIQMVFDRHKAALYRIYGRYLRENPALGGKVQLRITIDPDGTVSDCRVKATDIPSAAFLDAVIKDIKKFDFGPKQDAAKVVLIYPIAFLPNER